MLFGCHGWGDGLPRAPRSTVIPLGNRETDDGTWRTSTAEARSAWQASATHSRRVGCLRRLSRDGRVPSPDPEASARQPVRLNSSAMSIDTAAHSSDKLHRWVSDLFLTAVTPPRRRGLTADHLVLSNLSGHDSHGVGMVPRYVRLLRRASWYSTKTLVLTDAGGLMLIDAKRGIGQSVTHQAMAIAIQRAHQAGSA